MIDRCKRCGFEAATEFIVKGKCPACRLPVTEDMMNAAPLSAGKPRPVRMEECACGCGIKFNVYDYRGRVRKYCDRRHQFKHQVSEARRRYAISKGLRA